MTQLDENIKYQKLKSEYEELKKRYERLEKRFNIVYDDLMYMNVYQCRKCGHYTMKDYVCHECGYDNMAE